MLVMFNLIRIFRHKYDIHQLFTKGYSHHLKLRFSHFDQNDAKTLFDTNNDYIWKLCKTQTHQDYTQTSASVNNNYVFGCGSIDCDKNELDNEDIHVKLKLFKIDSVMRVHGENYNYLAITNDSKWFRKYIYNDLYRPTINVYWLICVIVDILIIVSIFSWINTM